MSETKSRPFAEWIDAEWEGFRAKVIDPDASADQLAEMRLAFVSGWFALSTLLESIAGPATLYSAVSSIHRHATEAARDEGRRLQERRWP